MHRLVLVEHRLGRIYGEDELLLVKSEARTKLMFAASIVGMNLGVILALKEGTDDGEVADRNVGCPRGGVTYGFTWAVYTDTPRVIGGSYREIGQNVRHRGVCGHRLKRGQAARRRGPGRGWGTRTVESGVFVTAKEEQFILHNWATHGTAETVVIVVRVDRDPS